MSETNTLTYAVLITLSIPEKDAFTTATVTLSPSDSLEVNGRSKTLGDCTLAELQAFATALEIETWRDYQAITLLALDEDEAIKVEVHLLESTLPLNSWHEKSILIGEASDELDVQETTSDGKETAVAEPVPDTPEPSAPAEEENEPQPEPQQETVADEIIFTPQPEVDEPIVTVSETEPVFEEIEADPSGTIIQPSQARVRVAGERLPIGFRTQAAVDILIEEPALRAAQAHALSSMRREVAGVLVGPRPEKQPDGRYIVRIVDTIIAKHTVMQGASVTYTPESWRYLNDTIRERYPNETGVMVGWYHTHPGFGIFLSGMDLFIHENFFTQIWHTALVLDPRAKTSGFFCWDRKKTRVNRHNFAWPHWAPGSW